MRALYAIVDPDHCAGRSALWAAERILHGGCAALQLRAKGLCDRQLLELAREMRALCRQFSVPFWLNDRLDLAMLVDADGLHLGQGDLPVAEARKLWGSRPLGVSTHSLDQALAAQAAGVDVIGFGPIFPTQTKPDAEPVVGLGELREICARLRVPVVAIGGIRCANVAQVRAAGASACAVISALGSAGDPEEAARELVAAWEAS